MIIILMIHRILCNLNIENKNEEFINNKNIYTLIDNIFYSKIF